MDVRNIKIDVKALSREQRAKVQSKLYELGAWWYAGPQLEFLDKWFLFVSNEKVITWDFSKSRFRNHSNREVPASKFLDSTKDGLKDGGAG